MEVSVLINTLNEEKNIKNCLESVKWADEIIIVDMHSEDRTVEIAREYTDQIFFHKRMGYADPARQFALDQASCEWVLVVDADEIVPRKLRDRLKEVMESDLADVVNIPHNNYFAGKQVCHMGWGPLQDLHPRFFKKKYLHFGDQIHDFMRISEEARHYDLSDPEEGFIHFSYLDFEHYIDKALNHYTTIEAKNIFEGKKVGYKLGEHVPGILFRLFRGFFDVYIRDKGYKDGFRGLSISFLSVIYNLIVYLKLGLMKEYNTTHTREKIRKEYQKVTDNVLLEYRDE
ncbi:glycosyltransferase family 2 protein [Methanobacterium formicicum]|uniref:Family 2 glycosyl transferase n=1 Tax=Methanobacterium formicicum (strain DSM 3637 / PP1) TaxID=1204725 RepID=K2RQ95_METFP|nr:glycosyltransferase family 2 protein [Methanobacterium formicicum]EKF84900.1 family 2 glycosyl transferase [Methanobacterium formicicum DSM 3637]